MVASINAISADQAIRRQRTRTYATQVWYFLVWLIFLIAVLRLASRFHSKYARRRRSSDTNPEVNNPSLSSSARIRHIALAIVNVYRIIVVRWAIQINIGASYTLNVAEVALTLVYIIAIFTWTFINTTNLEGQKFDPKYWCNRAGPIAASQFPLITALASKNNIISLFTGVGYDKLNYLHRMAARVVFVLLWTHAAGQFTLNGVAPEFWSTTWLLMGVAAVIALSLLVLVSLRPIRAKSYELFFWLHAALVLVLLVGAYYHTREFNFQKYVWPSFVIWGFDRLIRLSRVLVFTFSRPLADQQPKPESYHQDTQSSITATSELQLVSPDIIRLTVPRPRHFRWSPGQNIFLTIPKLTRFFPEAHPFTIATVDCKLGDSESNLTEDECVEKSTDNLDSNSNLVFFINVRSGFTKRLADYISVDAKNMNMKVFVDGPYGSPPDLRVFDTCVLLAGGTGVSYTFPLFLNLLEKVRKGKSNCGHLVFVWSIRDIRHITLISPTITKVLLTAPPTLEIDIRIHVTQHGSRSVPGQVSRSTLSSEDHEISTSSQRRDPEKVDIPELSDKQASSMLDLSTVRLIFGRPNIPDMLKEEANAVHGGRMGVSVCGPNSMVHSTRSALGMNVSGPAAVMKGGASVSLFVEAFGYA